MTLRTTPASRMYRLLLWAACLLFVTGNTAAQVVTFEPAFPSVEEPITVYFHATEGTGGLAGYAGEVYAHTGVITSESISPSDWKHVQTDWGENTPDTKLERIETDLYRLDIADIRAYYGVPVSEDILKLAFVFRSGQAVSGAYLEGKDTGGADIFIDLYDTGVGVRIVEPVTGPLNPFITPRDTTLQVIAVGHAVGSTYAGLRLLVDGAEVAQTADDTLSYALVLNEPGRVDVQAVATDAGGEADTVSFYAVRNPDQRDTDLPAGIEDGITYHPGDPTKVTLSLYAPYKEYVYVLGDFNGWEVDPAYLMHYDRVDYDSARFWITLDGLEAGREYAFQYLVDGELRIADPYTEKVLDPWNDASIPETIYPDLKPYPAGRTEQPVAVFQTGRAAYDWAIEDFDRPEPHELVIYELLVRDFVEDHDFETLTATLDYLDTLGVNAIELMPVNEFEGNSSWGYNPSFYFATDKYYGPAEDLKRFIDEAHRRGIAVILDLVLNHSYGQSPLVRLYVEGGRPAPENPWYNEQSNFENPDAQWGYDFDHESPATQAFVDRVTSYWLDEYQVDGFRFDFTKGFSNNRKSASGDPWGSVYDADRIRLLKRMVDAAWQAESGAYMIMEHLAENSEEEVLAEHGILLWGNMNHSYNEATMGYHDGGNSDLSRGYYETRGWSRPNLVTYMESHDEERLMFKNLEFGNSSGAYSVKDPAKALERMKAAGAFFFTLPGPKMIWQFGELGYDVSINQGGRLGEKPDVWTLGYDEDPLRWKLYKTWAALLKLRNEHEVFTSTDTEAILNTAGAVKTIKLSNAALPEGAVRHAVITGNFDVMPRLAAPGFPVAGTWYDYFSGETVVVSDVDEPVALAPGEFRIFTDAFVEPPEADLITVGVEDGGTGLPGVFVLERNYPNPFNPTTTIAYLVPRPAHVRLAVYDLLGREVAVLAEGVHQPGRYDAVFDARDLASGLYLYRLEADGRHLTGRMVLVK